MVILYSEQNIYETLLCCKIINHAEVKQNSQYVKSEQKGITKKVTKHRALIIWEPDYDCGNKPKL